MPAFSGLFAPYWRGDARGALVGLTRYVNKGHIARAALEATAFQTREVLDAMNADSGVDLTELKVDGGMIANETLMQFQADILGVPVVRPKVAETTALGAAYAAGIAVGFWQGEQDVIDNWAEDKRWSPDMDDAARDQHLPATGRRPSPRPSTGWTRTPSDVTPPGVGARHGARPPRRAGASGPRATAALPQERPSSCVRLRVIAADRRVLAC